MNLVLLFLLSLPWILLTLYLRLYFRHPRPLGESDPEGLGGGVVPAQGEADEGADPAAGEVADGERSLPFVSIVVPARNEEENIRVCVESLLASDYPAFEVLVVDDRSEDGTGDVVRAMVERSEARVGPGAGPWSGSGTDRESGENALTVAGEGQGRTVREDHGAGLRLIEGDALPEGWFGKPWACWQGAKEAKGDILLFTDADTRHAPGLLQRSITTLELEKADALTLVGRQGMESFWEQLLQPQFFLLLVARYPRVGVTKTPDQWRNAIANGQFILIRRDVYEEVGGHGAVAGEVVEDLRFAQVLVRSGRKLVVRETRAFYTRMYRSLGGLVEGWSKNVATAALQTTGRWLVPFILPLFALTSVVLWVLPPVVLGWALGTGTGGLLLQWSLLATSLSLYVWGGTSDKMEGNPLYGFLFPLGAVVALAIVMRSWLRGRRIRWKGREYRMSETVRAGLGQGATGAPTPRETGIEEFE